MWGLTSVSVRLSILTNASKIINYSKVRQSVCTVFLRVTHKVATKLPFIIIDYAILVNIFHHMMKLDNEKEFEMLSQNF